MSFFIILKSKTTSLVHIRITKPPRPARPAGGGSAPPDPPGDPPGGWVRPLWRTTHVVARTRRLGSCG